MAAAAVTDNKKIKDIKIEIETNSIGNAKSSVSETNNIDDFNLNEDDLLDEDAENSNEDDDKIAKGQALIYSRQEDSFYNYIHSFDSCEKMTREETITCFEEMKKHPKKKKEITDKLVFANIGLVVSIAKKIVLGSQSHEMTDLCQMGILGLYKAISMFDYTMGFAFTTYATNWVKQYMLRGLMDGDLIIRLPVHIREKNNYINKMINKLTEEENRTPKPEEILTEVKKRYPAMTLNEINYIQLISSTTSTDLVISGDTNSENGETHLGDFIVDPNSNPEKEALANINENWLWDQVEKYLTPKELKILKMRMGQGENQPLTLEKIGQMEGVSRERIRQIEARAIKKLRANFTRNGYTYNMLHFNNV